MSGLANVGSFGSPYTLRLRASDLAGNQGIWVTVQPAVGNFLTWLSDGSPWTGAGIDAICPIGLNRYTTISSQIPFPLTETIVVKNQAGAIVKHLVSEARPAGIYNNPWYGDDDSARPLPDGPYFYVATVTDGTIIFTRDLTTTMNINFENRWFDGQTLQAFDPFNNQPLTLTYTPGAAKITIVMSSQVGGDIVGDCAHQSADFFCLSDGAFQASGDPRVFQWAGLDPSGVYRGGTVRSVGIVALGSDFPQNAILTCGTAPTVTNVTVTPPVFGPANGTQMVAFDMSTYQSGVASVAITFMNLGSRSVLRRVNLAGQSPGHVTAAWDGRADNGMLVAPGPYAVTVTATDNIGNVVTGQILTTIAY
ncbi:MAG: FlgD immunoglobulin-like domain containing protein [Thermoanaerobaculia bacterium]